jgi:superfamily II DNA or RNA helicase
VEGDYKISALEKKIDTTRIRAQLLDSYLKFAKGKKGIIYSVSRKHSDHICQEYREAGINIVRIDSKTPKDERKLYVDRFRKGLIDIIVNVDIFSEGFDCPDIEFIQLARPTKSLVKYLQQVGRGLRPTAGKSICLILDNVGLHFQFGLPNSDRNWEESFVGSPHIPTRRNSSGGSILIEHKERNFSEGTDEMQLIVTSQRKHEETIKQWSDKDQELLKTLYEEKQCPIEILVAIFKRSEEEIRNKLSELTNRE